MSKERDYECGEFTPRMRISLDKHEESIRDYVSFIVMKAVKDAIANIELDLMEDDNGKIGICVGSKEYDFTKHMEFTDISEHFISEEYMDEPLTEKQQVAMNTIKRLKGLQ
jgi:hypothetical protein